MLKMAGLLQQHLRQFVCVVAVGRQLKKVRERILWYESCG